MQLPTTKDIYDRNLAAFESNLMQTSPLADKAFLRVLSAIESMNHTELYKFAAFMSMQNLALTASETFLELIGSSIDVSRKLAEAAVLNVTLPAEDGVIIPATIDFIGSMNGIRYTHETNIASVGGVASIQLTAEYSGTIGNLNENDTLAISSPVPGAQSLATVYSIENIGAEKEDLEIYRARVLFRMRAVNGGSNATDYKAWAEGVAGVKLAYPYAGKPPELQETSYPADRTVYIETDTDIDPDGIPGEAFLAEIKAALQIDPITGFGRACLGLTPATLYVVAITRIVFDVEITGLSITGEFESQAKAEIESGVDSYFRGLYPFVDGVDRIVDRNDTVTNLTLANVIQDILTPYGASAQGIEISISSTPYQTYTLDPGQTAKIGEISYV